MDIELTNEQRERLEKALLAAFDLNNLSRMLLLKLGFNVTTLSQPWGLYNIDQLEIAGRYLPDQCRSVYQPQLNGRRRDDNVLAA